MEAHVQEISGRYFLLYVIPRWVAQQTEIKRKMHCDTVEVVKFLMDNHIEIMSPPISGELSQVFVIYKATNVKIEAFKRIINAIHEISHGIELKIGDLNEEPIITYIDCAILHEFHCILKNRKRQHPKGDELKLNGLKQEEKFRRLIEDKSSDFQKRIEAILTTRTQATQLGIERAKQLEPVEPVIPRCNSLEHSELLSKCTMISNNKIISLKWPIFINQKQEFIQCVQNKIHFVPNMKPKTDPNLGDCSYLDTCHKMHCCRYVHYLQFTPQILETKYNSWLADENIARSKNSWISLYTRGECCSNLSRNVAPPQWIQCDVRKFDLSLLGKFSAVIADPAWNIHMHLPYGTCNDTELLNLPLNILQDEGILLLWVTGRAIELGKESLKKWGYKVINEISWVKTNQLGRTIVTGRTGHWLNHSKEHLLLGLKGDPEWLNRNIDLDIIVSPTRETSRKPDEVYGIVERLVGSKSRKLEIFGRVHNLRPGWITIGNQLEGTHVIDPEIKNRLLIQELANKKST